MSTTYNLLTPADAQLSRYEVKEDVRYSHLFQLITIVGETTSGRELLVSKVDTSLIATLNTVRIFYDPDTAEYMTAQEILTVIGFTLPQGSEVAR